MNVTLNNLKAGQWRNLSAQEMVDINAAVAGSSKTAINTTLPKSQQSSNDANSAKLSRQNQSNDSSPYYGKDEKTDFKSTPKTKKVFVNKNAKTTSASKNNPTTKPKLSLKRK